MAGSRLIMVQWITVVKLGAELLSRPQRITTVDIRTGFDFAAVKRGIYRSASDYLPREWKFWRETAPKYGFGRTELLPIKKTAEGVAKYVGKYVAKHIGQRLRSNALSRMALLCRARVEPVLVLVISSIGTCQMRVAIKESVAARYPPQTDCPRC
jgi:hypothetical protein